MNTKEKFQSIYKIFSKLLKKPSAIFLVLKDETGYRDYLHKKYAKTQLPTVNINYFLKDTPVEIKNYTFLEGGSLITDLALLKTIAAGFVHCDYLEIGTWRGESIVNVADAAGSNCVSINLSPKEIVALGLPEKYANEHGCLIKNRTNIQTIYANSLTFDFSTLKQKFDLVFIDGDHTYEAVKSDTANVFRLLKDENAVIVWHDYGFDPATPRYSVISAILDGMPGEEHAHLYHVSNTMCAVYTKNEEIRKFIEKSAEFPSKVFQISIEHKKFNP